jgi:Reverse transcriptase (RNA-dependent DNA polymerase)
MGRSERGSPSAGNDQRTAAKHMIRAHLRQSKNSRTQWSALIDRGANGCIAGKEMRLIASTTRTIDLSGIDDHTVRNLNLVTAGGVVRTPLGEIIAIIHQAADMIRESKTILSAGQLESFGCNINEKSPHITKRTPSIVTIEGYEIPIIIKKGLPYIRMRPFTDDDWNTLPHIILTSPKEWDPSVIDSSVTEQWYVDQKKDLELLRLGILTEDGKLKDDDTSDEEISEGGVTSATRDTILGYLTDLIQDELHDGYLVCELNGEQVYIDYDSDTPREVHAVTRSMTRKKDTVSFTSNNPARINTPKFMKPTKMNLGEYSKFFPGTNLETLQDTFRATTQLGTRGAVEGFNLRNRILAPNPMLTTPRRNEDVATDTLYSRTPAIDDGSTAAQFFIGRQSQFRSAVPMGQSDKRFTQALMDEIRKYGAMDRIISDNAKAQVSARVKEILRTFCIKDWQSEPHKGNQNFAERGWKDTKTKTNNLLNSSGAPAELWLHALQYVCTIQNHTAVASLNHRTPIEWLLGYTPDITVLLQFQFWEPVYYARYDAKFPSDSTEDLGRFIGIAENVGNAMTFKILTSERKVIHRSVVRSAMKDGGFSNRRANEQASGTIVEKADAENDVVLSKREPWVAEGKSLPTVDVVNLLGRTFINDPDSHGEQVRATIEHIDPTGDKTVDGKHELFKFRSRVGEKTFESVMTYNKMLEWCDRDIERDDYFKIDGIVGHKRDHGAGRGHQVLIQWGDGTTTWNDLGITFQDDPVTVSMYAQKNDLLDTDGWKDCKRYLKNPKKLARMINQARLKSNRLKPVYKYGHQVPRTHQEAMKIDEKFGNTYWRDAEQLEIRQLKEYEAFEDKGLGQALPEGYTKIPVHFVYDVKHDGRHKARLVAGGHRTLTPIDSVYSGVVSLAGIRLVTFLAELNDLELWGTDVGNAYLESYTKEKVAFIAGPEFGELEGHLLVIIKALYGLRSSGARWHDRLFDALSAMGFKPTRAHPDIWMRKRDGHYEYVAVYVDDLLIASRNPKIIIEWLEKRNMFKLKGTGPISFHLGCDFFRDEEGVLCVGPRSYIERMSMQYECFFGTKPRALYTSPLLANDHPELDTSDMLDDTGISQYQSILGTLQWAISLGRFDIATAVMTMSGFRVAPRIGHLDRLRRICGYLCKMKQGCLRVRTEAPDYSGLSATSYDWERTVYGNVKEEIPRDAPPALGKPVVLTSYVDANLYHDTITGRSVTGILHFVNQTPIEWFSKKQGTVETATYGSEFVAAKVATQQILALRTTLRYLGVQIDGPTRLFGDNGSVVTSGSLPHSPLRKRHHALAYHYTREAIASGAIDFRFISGRINPADVLSKHWGYQQVWRTALQPILFWRGDTESLLDDEDDDGECEPRQCPCIPDKRTPTTEGE